ncbi:hypothetical protein KKF38_01625 [Patescibacteria group bacterium]|nr:hypothetical protein [Patescibacteria group bacterium]
MNLDVLPIALSVISLVVSTGVAVWSWHKNRAIYDIERGIFFRHPEDTNKNNNSALIKKLNSGKYTILSTEKYVGRNKTYHEVLLGRIKK